MAPQPAPQESRLQLVTRTFTLLHEAGLTSPSFLYSTLRALRKHGTSTATGIAAAALAKPDEVGLIDDRGPVLYRTLYQRIIALSLGLRDLGVGPGANVAILCRNHRGFVEATGAAGLLGANSLFLNTGFAGPQLGEVLDRENAGMLIYDQEYASIVDQFGGDRPRMLAYYEGEVEEPTVEAVVGRYLNDAANATLAKPAVAGRWTILTSGTTGTPKGANRPSDSVKGDAALGLLEALPYRVGARTLVSAPTFHAWGLAQLIAAGTFGAPIVLQHRFDPERVLAAIEEHKVEILVVVPVMLQRILALPPETIGRYDTSSLIGTLSSGSALPGELALRWMDAFGDNLYNFYGSTEVAQAAIAGPADLRAAPGTAGRPPRGTIVRILDKDGREVAQGTTGRIFVANGAQFEGYTGGGGKEIIDGLMSSGDLGHFDKDGRLFVEGRDDDMIVSGGENVFPSEVEDLLSDHPALAEAAVIGVEDEDFGQRLRAFVVPKEQGSVTEAELKDYVKSHLARHKVPREVIFLVEIPRNPTGKVLKRQLREWKGEAFTP